MRSFRTKVCDGGESSVVSPPAGSGSATAVPEVECLLFRVKARPMHPPPPRQCEPLRSPFQSREYMPSATQPQLGLSCRSTSRLVSSPRTGVAVLSIAHHLLHATTRIQRDLRRALAPLQRDRYTGRPSYKYPHLLLAFVLDGRPAFSS